MIDKALALLYDFLSILDKLSTKHCVMFVIPDWIFCAKRYFAADLLP